MATEEASGSDGKGQEGGETSVTYHRLEEVMKRNSSKELWLVIHGRVYDITRFLNEVGPGRWEALGSYASESFEDVGHSSDARRNAKAGTTLLLGILDFPHPRRYPRRFPVSLLHGGKQILLRKPC
uniref:Cytochrome b5 type B n=1 Tax=Sciurus vulgaris TaxID=55149 RepID=A0A8D2DVL4_SCIVU